MKRLALFVISTLFVTIISACASDEPYTERRDSSSGRSSHQH